MGGRREEEASEGLSWFQKDSADTYYSNGLWPINKIFNIGLFYPMGGIEWRLLREICVSSRRQQLLPPRGSKFRVVMARCHP